MKSHTLLFPLMVIATTLITLTVGSGCANMIPPTGGPRDSLPPVLVQALPRDSSKHVNTNKIVFYFNEYVDVRDQTENIIVSPLPKVNPIIDGKLRTVTVRLKDSLRPNTTYSIQFGKSIRDVNEGNILRNFTYVFSTGSYIDSMEYSGNVIIASTGKTDSTLIVMLHRSLDDSAVIKERPRYVTKVDSNGHFRFRYLEPGTYAVYSMKDEGGAKKYLTNTQLFAFADSPVVINGPVPPLTLYAFAGKEEPKKSGTGQSGKSGVKAAAPKEKDKEKEKRLIMQTTISNGELDVLGTLDLIFASPLKVFDSSLVRFTDENFNDIRNYHFVRDSTNKTFTLVYNWPTETKFHLIAQKEFAQDSAGRMLLKTDSISFLTKKESDYGEVRLRFRNLDLPRNPVLQFISGDAVKFSHVFTAADHSEFRKKLFLPGEYELRILYDDNKNGIWDPGEFINKHRQPEKVQPIKGKFNVKNNWDNDKDFVL